MSRVTEIRYVGYGVADLAAEVEHGKIRDLTIAAPPRALGVLRAHYTQGLRGVIRHEVAHDYVKMPVHEIEKLLVG